MKSGHGARWEEVLSGRSARSSLGSAALRRGCTWRSSSSLQIYSLRSGAQPRLQGKHLHSPASFPKPAVPSLRGAICPILALPLTLDTRRCSQLCKNTIRALACSHLPLSIFTSLFSIHECLLVLTFRTKHCFRSYEERHGNTVRVPALEKLTIQRQRHPLTLG